MNNKQDAMTRIIEQAIERQIGQPVRYDSATGEFVVVGDDDQRQTEERKE